MTNRFQWAPFRRMAIVSAAVLVITIAFGLIKQSQRVVKASAASAPVLGDSIPHLTSLELTMFSQGNIVYIKTWDPRQGLGPVYTQDNCTNCHGSPIAGGGGGSLNNIDTIFATVDSTGQFDPMDGTDPADANNEGGVLQQPQTISAFVPKCNYPGEVIPTTPNFPVAATLFEGRFAPPNFGMGLIDSIPASQIEAQAIVKGTQGEIQGVVNNTVDQYGNGAIGKFGYKAEAGTLIDFIGNAMTLELGVTNPAYKDGTEQESNGLAFPPCILKGDKNEPVNDPLGQSLITIFHYLLYLAPNTAAPCTSNACLDGQTQFSAVGCNYCHLTPAEGYTTGNRIEVPKFWDPTSECGPKASCFQSRALSNQPVPLYSDLLLHDMGPGTASNHLGDGFCSPQPVLAGDCPFFQASGNQFRTTPLWGLGVKLANGYPLLHDGRTTNVTTAIQDHAINGQGEARDVVAAFNNLTSQEQSDLITFLGTL